LLDQGYFPGGVYTPKTDEIMRSDVNMYKRMGFNGLRKHQKVEDPRFLYWCDVEGLVVWEEMPSLGFGVPGYVPDWAMERFEKEWMDVIERDYNHPSIIVWTVYNESWGIYEMLWRKEVRDWGYRMVRKTRESDSSRLTVDNSGGFHFDTDIWDFHHYLPTVEDSRELYEKYDFESGDHLGFSYYIKMIMTGKPLIPLFFPDTDYAGQPVIVSEYGGFGFYKTEGEKSLYDLYRDYTLAIFDFSYLDGYCYTQPYDVEQEKNGLMTFERKPKVPPEKIRKVNEKGGY
ncbi:MAG: glycoside hydrolase family 2 TIM barrel-domain containing protein, partial [bacterium]